MTYIIIYLILNQLAHMFILHVAKTVGDEAAVTQLGTLGGWLFNAIIGFPLALCGTIAGVVSYIRED